MSQAAAGMPAPLLLQLKPYIAMLLPMLKRMNVNIPDGVEEFIELVLDDDDGVIDDAELTAIIWEVMSPVEVLDVLDTAAALFDRFAGKFKVALEARKDRRAKARLVKEAEREERKTERQTREAERLARKAARRKRRAEERAARRGSK